MHTILIIGAGFCGAVTAIQLTRGSGQKKLRVILLNRSGLMARGLAYGTHSRHHALNVPAGNMSALHSEPDHFLQFARHLDPGIGPSSFVARHIYGDYLEQLLESAEKSCRGAVTLERVTGEVSSLTYAPDGTSVHATLENGQQFDVDKVVLAFGHFPANRPTVADPSFYSGGRFISDPWNAIAVDAIHPDASILLLGSGLTAIDIAATLLNRGSTRTVHVLSRHGLLVKAHRSSKVPALPPPLPPQFNDDQGDLRALLRVFRQHVRDTAAFGADWHEALNALRPETSRLWKTMSQRRKRQFLRHVQPFWDNHRHRAAPSTHQWFEDAIEKGTVRVHAGRIVGFEEQSDGVNVQFRPRGAKVESELRVQHVINCIGPNSDLNRVDNTLVRQLLSAGMMRRDELGLGLDVAKNAAVVGKDGHPSQCIFYIGPLLKAEHWEATAVPELRRFAEELARNLLESTL